MPFNYNPGTASTASQSDAKGNSMLLNALMALMSPNSGGAGAAGAAAAPGNKESGAAYNTPTQAGTDFVYGSDNNMVQPKAMNGY